jgi:hypothetical protein
LTLAARPKRTDPPPGFFRYNSGGAPMPIHDWTRVTAGTWHDFHVAWVVAIQSQFNQGFLPPNYYAQIEPDSENTKQEYVIIDTSSSSAEAEMNEYVLKRRTVVIRHASDDRIVALLELVSPGNKSTRRALRSFVEKAVEALYQGYHLTVVDLFPPTPRDPNGIHGAIWAELSDDEFHLPPETPLTLAAYSAGVRKKAYLEPTAVGTALIDMPIFLDEETYVDVPLEATYEAAYRGVPRRWKQVLE